MFPPLVHLLRVLVRRHPHVPQVPLVPKNFAHRPAQWVRKGQEELAGHLPLHLLVCPCGQTPLFSVLRDLDGREVRNPEKKMFRVGPPPPPPEHCGMFLPLFGVLFGVRKRTNGNLRAIPFPHEGIALLVTHNHRRGVPCGGQCATLANPAAPPREGGSLADPAHDVRVARACALGPGNHGLQDLDIGVEGLPHTEPHELAVLEVGDGQQLVLLHGADQCCKKDTCSKVCQRQEARSQTPLPACVT